MPFAFSLFLMMRFFFLSTRPRVDFNLVQRVLRSTRRGKLIHSRVCHQLDSCSYIPFSSKKSSSSQLQAPIIAKYYEYTRSLSKHTCATACCLHGLNHFHGVSCRAMERCRRIFTSYGSSFNASSLQAHDYPFSQSTFKSFSLNHNLKRHLNKDRFL